MVLAALLNYILHSSRPCSITEDSALLVEARYLEFVLFRIDSHMAIEADGSNASLATSDL